MQRRRRFKQTVSLEDRLDRAQELRKAAESLSSGAARDRVLRMAVRDETAARITAWMSSPGLMPPA